ncbi:hypothetical protein EDD36DRAFT_443535 [Exophiala viscosa]|uniref:DUF2470 domain-containing protein n=1 Tax=Exophiala viscosa TaxID=2486360 RepID=A0AAN6DQ51_9EURO|nr:hypothetical protein EDD36DRAFT_443535 [Exophiala viscosa]
MSTTAPAPTSVPSGPPPTAQRGPPDPAAMKARVIQHMNADHALSLRLYLAHYAHVPLPGTTTAAMQDITNEHMIITSSYGRHVVSLDPPMKSLIEARERLVAMHNECLAALGLSDVVLKSYTPPDRAWQCALSALCLLIFATFPFREQLRPESGSVIASIWSLGGLVPGLARLSYTLQPYVLGIMVVLHGAEAVWFTNRLKRYWVEVGTWVWWCWVGDCLLEGVGCLTRFERVVGRLEAEKKH